MNRPFAYCSLGRYACLENLPRLWQSLRQTSYELSQNALSPCPSRHLTNEEICFSRTIKPFSVILIGALRLDQSFSRVSFECGRPLTIGHEAVTSLVAPFDMRI
jgi:hypothetical protein